MRSTVRGIIVGAVTAVVAVPFVAIAQEPPPDLDPADAAEPGDVPPEAPSLPDPAADQAVANLEAEDRGPGTDGLDTQRSDAQSDTQRPDGSGPPWYDGDEPFVGDGPPPWAPAHGYRGTVGAHDGAGPGVGPRPGGGPPFEPPGPPPWAGSDDAADAEGADDADDGTGPAWWSGPEHDGEGPPPWAGRGTRRGPAGSDG